MNEDKIIEKTIEETAKLTIGKMVDGVGTFLKKICLPAAEEFGFLLEDQIKYYRINNLFKIIKKVENELSVEKLANPVHPRLIREFAEEASWAEDDGLQAMWAGLLKGIIKNSKEGDSSLIYSNILKQLNGFQARLVNKVYEDYRIASTIKLENSYVDNHLTLNNEMVFQLKDILKLSHIPLCDIVAIENATHDDILNNSENHHLALAYFSPHISMLKRVNLISGWNLISNDGNYVAFIPTYFGLDFHMRCSGYYIYPLEAWLTTRKHWCKQKGIEPNSWRPSGVNI